MIFISIGKYAWQMFSERGEETDSWPTVADLSLDSFAKLHLLEVDKAIGLNKYQPVDGKMPRKHLSTVHGGNKSIGSSLEKMGNTLGESSFRGQVAMANAISCLFKKEEDNTITNTEPFTFEFFRDEFHSLSPIYDTGETSMEDVMNYMWSNDRSGVFDFQDKIMEELRNKNMIIRLFVSSAKMIIEKEFGTETFALLNASSLSRLCQSNAVKIRVETKNVVTETLAQRQLFSWK